MRSRRTHRAAALAGALLLAGCTLAPTAAPIPTGAPVATPTAGPSEPATSASPAPRQTTATTRADAWRSDLAALLPAMDRIHPDLDHGTSRAELDAAVAALSARAGSATDDELLVGLLGIVALVSREGCDSHTGAFVWGNGTYPTTSLPLRLWLFDDEVVIVDALAPHESLVGGRIDAVEGHPIADVLAALDPIIPRDNAQTVRLLTPRYLLMPEVLRGLGLADDGPVSLSVSLADGASRIDDVTPIPMASYNAWAGLYGLSLPADPSVRWLSRLDDALWWETLSDGRTVYLQANRMQPLDAATLAGLRAALTAPGIDRAIVDLRNDVGGEVLVVDQLAGVLADPVVVAPGRLFVLIGRNTYSAASLLVARLERETDATLVGEAMGGCPTLYGDPESVTLPGTGIVVDVASRLEVGVDPDDPRLTIEPDARAILTVEEWRERRDPAIDAIVGVAP